MICVPALRCSSNREVDETRFAPHTIGSYFSNGYTNGNAYKRSMVVNAATQSDTYAYVSAHGAKECAPKAWARVTFSTN